MGLSRTIITEHAAVASEQPLASTAGYDVLRKGGNAFDAAVATSYALAVTFHPAGGIGGDFFGMFYEARTGKVLCLNASGWAPSGLDFNLITSAGGNAIPTHGPLTCMVPGLVAGVSSMHDKLGSLPFPGLMKAALDYSTNGFPAGEGLCRSTAVAFASLSDDAKAVFVPSGAPPSPGEWIRQEALGRVLTEISDGGEDAFYRGWPAESICSKLQDLGVPARLGDFEFEPEWVQPLSFEYHNTTVYEVPPNSMGATTLLMLKALADKDLSKTEPLSKERLLMTMEAAELAYARRDEFLGDPRFGKIDLEKFMDTSAQTSREVPGKLVGGDTTAFSIVDSQGNIVSGIQSLFHHFGSRVFVPGTGIVLNNRGAGFNTQGPNLVQPHKRPLHTLSSLILARDGRPYIGMGASGGEYRPMQHTLFVTNLVDYKMSLERAIEHQRFLWSGGKSLIAEGGQGPIEPGKYDIQELPFPGRTGVCQGVEVSGRFRKGVCDARGDGIPTGF